MTEQNNNGFSQLLNYIDVVIVLIANIFLHYNLTNPDFKIIVIVISSLIVLGRIIVTTKISADSSKSKVRIVKLEENINKQSELFNQKLDSMEKVIPLIQEQNRNLISNVNTSYLTSCAPELWTMKNNILNDTLDALKQINIEDQQKFLSHSNYYNELFDAFEKMRSGKEIYAVSFLTEEEWEDSPQEEIFWKKTLESARNGIKTHRIFISTKTDMVKSLENKKIYNHFDNRIENLEGFFIDKTLLIKSEPKLIEEAASGFIVFDDDYAFTDKIVDEQLNGRKYTSNFIISNIKRIYSDLYTYNDQKFKDSVEQKKEQIQEIPGTVVESKEAKEEPNTDANRVDGPTSDN